MITRTKRKLSKLVTVVLLSLLLPLMSVNNGWVKESVDEEISSYIEQLKNHSDWRKRSQATSALGKIDQETSIIVPTLIEGLQDEDEVVRLRASFALAKIGLPAVPDLIEALKEDKVEVRSSAALALRIIGFSAYPKLTEALKSENQRVRSSAVSILKQITEDFKQDAEFLFETAYIAKLKQVQAVSLLEEALRVLEPSLEDSLALQELGYNPSDIRALRQVLITFKSDIRAHNFRMGVNIFFQSIVLLIILVSGLIAYCMERALQSQR